MPKSTRCPACGSLLEDDNLTAAERVIEAFGGASRLSDLTGIDKSSVYRWKYPKDRGGTDGAIPHGNHGAIMRAAVQYGIKLTRSDLV